MTASATICRRAIATDTQAITVLFDGYRQFYQQPADLVAAGAFIRQRLESGDSAILLAEYAGEAAGFVQLYPSFSSVSMTRVWLLNDLYVAPQHRRSGVASALLQAAESFAMGDGARGLRLATQKSNHSAKALYEQAGWHHEQSFDHYQRLLG